MKAATQAHFLWCDIQRSCLVLDCSSFPEAFLTCINLICKYNAPLCPVKRGQLDECTTGLVTSESPGGLVRLRSVSASDWSSCGDVCITT